MKKINTFLSSWFQNKEERNKEWWLLYENSMLKKENSDLKIAARYPICNACGPFFPRPLSLEEKNLQVENDFLKEEVTDENCLTKGIC